MQLSEFGRIKGGVSLSRYKPASSDQLLIIKVFKSSHCKPTDIGCPPDPTDYEVGMSFSQPRQVLQKGDILVAKRFTNPGCVVFKGNEEKCYVSENVAVIRPDDKEKGKFVADYLNSDLGRQALLELSNSTPYAELRSISIADLKSLTIQDMSVEEMRAFSLRSTTAQLEKKSDLNKRDIGLGASRLVDDIKGRGLIQGYSVRCDQVIQACDRR